jgi:hypothetical protein
VDTVRTSQIVIYTSYLHLNKPTATKYVAGMGEGRGAYRALVGKPEGRRPLERPRRRWEDNIKMDLREVGWGRRLD